MTFRNTSKLLTALALLLAACQPAGPPPPTGVSTSLAAEAAEAQLAAALEARGFRVERANGGLSASSDSADFAKCLPVNVTDGSGDGRRQFTQVQQRQAMALVRFTPAANGAEVSWSTSYSGRYLNKIDNNWFERTCEGTGELEALLKSSVAG